MSQREEDIVRSNSHISNYTSQLPTPRALNLINFLNWHLGMTICFFWRKKWFKEELQHMLILVFRPGRAACGILVPHPGTEPDPLAVKAWSLNHWTISECPKCSHFLRPVIPFLDVYAQEKLLSRSRHMQLNSHYHKPGKSQISHQLEGGEL